MCLILKIKMMESDMMEEEVVYNIHRAVPDMRYDIC